MPHNDKRFDNSFFTQKFAIDEEELPSGFLEVDSVDFNVSKLLETERQVH